jgi:hypothetical protein
MDDQGSVPDRGWVFSLLHLVQTGCEAHPASCPIGTGRSIPGGKAAGT